MKQIAGLLFIATMLLCQTGEAKHRQELSGNMGIFYSSLSPHGEWVNADFGFAWRPHKVNRHWRPYMHGRWMWTDYGWYWVSDEPFGWATYHYGRWNYDDYYGWIWIPDRVWGPAWVEWRYDDNYIGWAPLTPYAEFSVNLGIVLTNHWVAPVHYWNFLNCRRFTTARVSDYVEPVERTRRFFGNTRGVVDIRSERDRVINAGIDNRFVERRTNTRIQRVDVVDRDQATAERYVKDARRMRIEAYRPTIDDLPRADRTAAPGGRIPSNGETRSSGMGRRDGSERPSAAPNEEGANTLRQRGRERFESQRESFNERKERGRAMQEKLRGGARERTESQTESLNAPKRQERQVQEQQRSRNQERPTINKEPQQRQRDRSPARTPQPQGEQRSRGRRPG